MNVRPTDSTALAAAADLFAATSACHEMGPIPFERLLRTNSPPPLSRPAQPDVTPVSRTDPPPSRPDPATTSRPVTERTNNNEAPTEPAAEEDAGAKVDPADETHPATDVTSHGRERVDDALEASTDLAAASLSTAATQQVPTPVVETQPKEPAADVSVEVVDASRSGVQRDARDIVNLRGGATETSSLEVVPTVAETPIPEITVPTEGVAEVQPPLLDEATARVALRQEVTTGEHASHGIGVMPSALVGTPAPRPKSDPRNPGRSISPAQQRDIEPQRDIHDGTLPIKPPPEEVRQQVETVTSRSNELVSSLLTPNSGEQPHDRPIGQPELASVTDQSLPSLAPAANDAPAPTATRNAITEPRVANSAIQPGQPPSPPPPSPLTSRLPANVLVRGNGTGDQAGDSGALHVDTVRFVQRVARAFESARDQGGEIRLRLSPPELGSLRVEVNLVDQGLVARVEAETPEARTVLLENLPALRDRLAEQGVRLERFDVDLSQQRSGQDRGQQPDQTNSRQQPHQQRASNAAAPADVVELTARGAQAAAINQDRRLNVIV